MKDPISTIGTFFSYSKTESGEYTEVDIKTYGDPFGAPEAIDVTHMRNTSYASIPGLKGSASAIEMTANYDPDVFSAIAALGDGEVYQKLTFGDSSGAKWKGRLAVSLADGAVNGPAEMTLHAFRSSDPTFFNGTATSGA